MAENDIHKLEIVKVIAEDSEYKGQVCQVVAIEHNTQRRRKISDTWYLLDTRQPQYQWSMPAWFERHEIERVPPPDMRRSHE